MKFLFSIITSLVLLACQPGQIDRFIIGCFESRTNEKNSLLNRDNVSYFNADKETTETIDAGLTEKLEIPSFDKGEIILHRTAYTSCYDPIHKIPKWVAWHLTSEHTYGDQKRLSNFIVDEDVPYPRAETIDYKDSGYDRGHMCPAGDNKWAFKPMQETFLLSNICPQNRNLNCGDWNELEISCRNWANKYGDIYIATGPILYRGEHETIGPNKVTVPEAFFKVVLCLNGNPKGIGFIYKNNPTNKAQSSYVNTIEQVERITGIDFFPNLPDDIEEQVESVCNLSDW